jgi:hypothetical protein
MHEAVWRNGGVAPRVLYLVTGWELVVSFTPGHFTRGEEFTYTNLVGDWGGPGRGAGRDALENT